MPGAVVVGTSFGCRVHVPALRAAGFDVVALVGRDEEKTQRRAARLGIERTASTLADALSFPGVDAVTIATPPVTHARLAIVACDAGRDVICEKPFALDSTEAEAMVAAAERAGVTALVGHEFRWAEDRATVGWAIAQGMIGTPRMATLVQYIPLVADPGARVPEWWFDGERGGGWLGASGSHVVDQVRTWLGEFESVSARLPVVSQRTGVAEDSFAVRATLVNGVDVVLQQTAASWIPQGAGMTMVAGTCGTLELASGEIWLSDRDGRRRLDVPHALRLPPAPAESDDPRQRFSHLELGPYTRLCEALGGARSQVAVPTFADGLANVRVLDAVRASARAGGSAVAVEG